MNRLNVIIVFFLLTGQLHAQNTPWTGNGPVGIGTLYPSANLHVAGNTPYVNTLVQNTSDGLADMILQSNNLSWMWSKRASTESNSISLMYNDGNNWLFPGYINVQTNGNTGIGYAVPTSKLHVQGINLGDNPGSKANWFTLQGACGSGGNNSILDFYNYRTLQGNNWLSASTRIQQTIDATQMGFVEFNPPNMLFGLALGTGNQYRFYINGDGQVGIGTTGINDANYKLFVQTGIRTRKIKVDQDNWSDYVFGKEYTLRPIAEVEKFIQQYQHLPEVPSAADVKKEGIDLGENQTVLLKKIEELTLYLIEQNRQLAEQQKRIEILERNASSHK